VEGRSPEHELVLQGRLEGQAPDIDPVVFLTDCDPEEYVAGQLIQARIVGARGYDLVAAPVSSRPGDRFDSSLSATRPGSGHSTRSF
jgi:hypothetical protein